MAAAGGAPALIVSGGFIGVALLSCTASSLAMTSVASGLGRAARQGARHRVSAAGSLGTLLVPLTTQALLARQTWQIGVLFFLFLAAVMQTTLWGSLDPTRVNHDYSQISSPLPHRLEISGVGGNPRWRAAGRDMSVTMADLPPPNPKRWVVRRKAE